MLDYKYIEQLLERYWECQTTLEEEAILRSFFAQDSVPVELLQYRQLFVAQAQDSKNLKLDESFDERIMSIIDNEQPVKARTITLSQRLRPFFRAAAVVAILLTLGTAAQKALEPTTAPYPEHYTKQNVDRGSSVAVRDSIKSDTLKMSDATPNKVIVE